MGENTMFVEEQMAGTKIILYVLTFTPVIYVLMIVLLQQTAVEPTQNMEQDPIFYKILPIVLIIVSAVHVLLTYSYFLPLFVEAKDFNDAFAKGLVTIVLIEAVAIYGLLIALLQLFSGTGDVLWIYVLFLNFVSLFINYTNVSSTILPKLNEFAQKSTDQPANTPITV